MKLDIELRRDNLVLGPRVVFFSTEASESPDNRSIWLEFWLLLRSYDPNAVDSANHVSIEYVDFLRGYESIASFLALKNFDCTFGSVIIAAITKSFEGISSQSQNISETLFESQSFEDVLELGGWDNDAVTGRTLTSNQKRDLKKLLDVKNGANFSVPGAGKTTVLLALHTLLNQVEPMELIVVAPGNAFGAWSQATIDCLTGHSDQFQRLLVGRTVPGLLLEKRKFRIVSYAQLTIPIVEETLKKHLMENPVHLVLDESHRIKGGSERQAASAALDLAPFAARRDVLSGTPMPNSVADISPQLDFLVPGAELGKQVRDVMSANLISEPFRVRTLYSELGVPRPTPKYLAVEMSDSQKIVYAVAAKKALREMRLARKGIAPETATRNSIMAILQAAMDPQLVASKYLANGLASELSIEEVCLDVLDSGPGPRIEQAIKLARENVANGRKVVIWAPFTETIKKIALALEDLGSQIINGETPTGGVDEVGSREAIISKFHSSSAHSVLVANPAAGGEGISLHKACQTAIYLGRTYNAAHYMQSRDRICRLGMPENSTPTITILESLGSPDIGPIDLSVRRRLDLKIRNMSEVLDDKDLALISMESDDADSNLEDGTTFEDIQDLLDLWAP